ncbi:MAG: T9SS type A sorting domain-containing protein [Chitinophagaceae bacterium]|nr:T9SS type A sorting domain-containing protein [Chitinophagaceae bacterium]
MKKPTIILLIAALFAVIGFSTSCSMPQPRAENEETSLKEEGEEWEEEEEEEAGADKQMTMLFQARAYPNPYNLDAKYQRAWEQVKKIRTKTDLRGSSFSNWTSLGQSYNGATPIGGRIKCIAIEPVNRNNLWAGSASGGIWKSTNAGANWTYVPTNMHVLGVSAILIDPTNANTIYAGTGEVYRVDTSNIGFNVWKTRGTYGIGVIKSTDGGANWSQVWIKNTSQMFAIQNMIFNPQNSKTLFAAATDGLYRSRDNGLTWTSILSKIYVKDVCMHPTDSNQIVVSVGNMVNADKGIYRTTNGGTSWTRMGSPLPNANAFEGSILLDNVGTTICASIGVSSSGTPTEVYRSTDFGATWAAVGGSSNHCSYQFWFAHTIAINPFFTDSILYGGVNIYRSRFSTGTRSSIGGLHADHHDIKFDPVARGTIYVCNDGGIYRSTNGGSSFTAINNGLNATQFYASLGVSSNVTTPDRMVGGLQDNGQVQYNGSQWNQLSWAGGDGTACAIDPNNHNNVLVSRDARQVYRSTNGGGTGGSVTSYWGFVADSRTSFVSPLAFAKSSVTRVYLASDNIHISNNSGLSFSNDAYASATNYIESINKTAIALAVSSTNANKVYVSTSNFAQADNDVNNIIVTGQPNLLRTTTGGTPFTSIKGNLPDRFITDIAISPTNDDSIFVTLGGFGTAHVYVTGNASLGSGTVWTPLGGIGGSGRVNSILPDVPFNAIVFDPVNSNIIYAGCDFGVYVSSDRGNSWVDFSTGFTDAALVMDLQITSDNKIVAATHGKGVYRSDLFSGSTLPVRLVSFGGINAGAVNKLHWTASQELNLDRYELQRSTDGINYHTMATIAGRNSPVETTYNHNDPVNLVNAEYYYRLKIVDLDGTYDFSVVVFIRVVNKNSFSVVGNPFQDYIVLKYTIANDQPINIGFFNSAGALVRKESYNATSGTGIYTLYGLANYPAGMYLLRLESGGHIETFKVIKQ